MRERERERTVSFGKVTRNIEVSTAHVHNILYFPQYLLNAIYNQTIKILLFYPQHNQRSNKNYWWYDGTRSLVPIRKT